MPHAVSSEPPFEETTVTIAPVTRRQRPIVSWENSDGQKHQRAVTEPTLVGSAPRSGIVVSSPTVSRLHAELEPRDDGLWVRDLGSLNGTCVDGIRILNPRVPAGSRIFLGSTALRVDYEREVSSSQAWPTDYFGALVGATNIMRELFASLAHIAPTDSSVLVNGETGTGKELVARAIHDASPRARQPFVIVDCAAIPEALLDSELFGHAKGAFTGAIAARAGAIESADGGTVFLDEIGELPMSMQPKLLRVLESRTLRRVGESTYRAVDVRFISATHRDLLTMVNAREFREDLYFRLAVVPVVVPALRSRPADIPLLVERFLVKGSVAPSVSLNAFVVSALTARAWRGNVRELRNFVERASAFGAERALAMMDGETEPRSPADLRVPGSGAVPSVAMPESPTGVTFEQGFKGFRESWAESGDREYLRRLLERHGRNVSAAALEAGVDRTYIYRLIRKLAL